MDRHCIINLIIERKSLQLCINNSLLSEIFSIECNRENSKVHVYGQWTKEKKIRKATLTTVAATTMTPETGCNGKKIDHSSLFLTLHLTNSASNCKYVV